MERCDVLVIGLGPAGGAAARACANGGLSVLGVERKQTVGVPVQCAEFIPLPLSAHVNLDGLSAQRIAAMQSVLQSGEKQTTDFRGWMIDRAAFDRSLVEQAVQQGARVLSGSRLVAFDLQKNTAQLATPDGSMTVTFRVLIAADGPHSTVAAGLGLPELAVVHTRQYCVPLLRPRETTEVWLSERYPGGYAWLFPKGEAANLGLGVDKLLEGDLKSPLDALHGQLVAEGILGSEILSRTGGMVPVSGLREQLVVGNVLFVGDAAGLTHPISGAGIAPAVVSGDMAGQACVAWLSGKLDALVEFEAELREIYHAPLQHAVVKREWMIACWQRGEYRADMAQRKSWIAFPEYYAARGE